MSSSRAASFTVPGLLLALVGASIAAPGLKPIPGPPVIQIELEHNQLGHRSFSSKLSQATVEPGGFEVTAGSPAEWFAIGFKTGDIILAENGSPVGERMFLNDGIHVFDVVRNKKPIMLRVIVHPASRRTRTLDEQRFDKLVEHAKTSDPRSTPLRNASGPSGVRVIDTLLSLYLEVEVGDLIRTIDGQPIHGDAQLTAAIENLRVGNTDFMLERNGRPLTLTIIRKAPLDLTQIKKLTGTRYEVPKTLADAVFADTDILTRKLSSTPHVINGAQHGYTVYDINPDAPMARLGLLDGDVVLDIDGHRIDSFENVIDATRELEHATTLVVHLLRKGKPVTLTYVVTP
ncbi:MAG: PDZ domain-containing protein [Deltaproteobacteria bacterium]|nr:PDZ domain-containing protein [Deltaproteobacteria bacterium]